MKLHHAHPGRALPSAGGNGYDDSGVARYVEILKSVEGFVFCYPHWWYSMPAALKGYIDRVFAGDPGRKVVMRGMKPMCAKDVSTFWLAHYDMDHSTPQSREAYLEKVRAQLDTIR